MFLKKSILWFWSKCWSKCLNWTMSQLMHWCTWLFHSHILNLSSLIPRIHVAAQIFGSHIATLTICRCVHSSIHTSMHYKIYIKYFFISSLHGIFQLPTHSIQICVTGALGIKISNRIYICIVVAFSVCSNHNSQCTLCSKDSVLCQWLCLYLCWRLWPIGTTLSLVQGFQFVIELEDTCP
jgi:hypothetical protein